MNITDIYKIERQYLTSFIGTLRNEKKFNIGDNVWFSTSRYQAELIFRGVIIGVELTLDENPEYIYKIKIPDPQNISEINNCISNIRCDSIFSTIEEAKQSAIASCESKYRLQMEDIKRYFSQFEQNVNSK